MNPQLETLKTELRELIKLSETITPGPWVKGWNIVGNGKDKDICFAPMRNPTLTTIDWPTDATFIARSRNISPTMAKMLLAQIEWLELHAVPVQEANRQLAELLKLWEETK